MTIRAPDLETSFRTSLTCVSTEAEFL